jgi:hypothetical protein
LELFQKPFVTSRLGQVKVADLYRCGAKVPKEFSMFAMRAFLLSDVRLGSSLTRSSRCPSPNTLMEDVMTRRSFIQTLSPADRKTVAKWTRGVAASYASIALLTCFAVAVAHYRGEGTQNQIVTLRPMQIN